MLMSACALLLALPAAAEASSRQLTLIQDEDSFVDGLNGSTWERLEEARGLGAGIVRINLYWRDASPAPTANGKPAGFVVGDPASPGYRWGKYDGAIAAARRLGFRVYITVSGPIPHWGSRQPSRCDGDASCSWRPNEKEFGQFVKAAARRYRGQVRYWSIWNEPNLSGWLSPQYEYRRKVRASARIYRRLWWESYKAIRKYDPRRRGSVLFGETAPFAGARPFIRWALCLNPDGRPVASRRRGCPRRPTKLPIAAMAHHPYPAGAVANPRMKLRSESNITISYLHNLERVIDLAAKYRRMSRGKPIFITEYGIQTNPPDRYGASLRAQQVWLDESARLVFGDRRVWTMGQFLLEEPADPDTFNTGLRFDGGKRKPSWYSFRLPIVVTERSRHSVEVWGWVRPATKRVRLSVYARRRGSRSYTRIRSPLTNPRGMFRLRYRRRGAGDLVYKLKYRAPDGSTWYSRYAYAGRPLGYRR